MTLCFNAFLVLCDILGQTGWNYQTKCSDTKKSGSLGIDIVVPHASELVYWSLPRIGIDLEVSHASELILWFPTRQN